MNMGARGSLSVYRDKEGWGKEGVTYALQVPKAYTKIQSQCLFVCFKEGDGLSVMVYVLADRMPHSDLHFHHKRSTSSSKGRRLSLNRLLPLHISPLC